MQQYNEEDQMDIFEKETEIPGEGGDDETYEENNGCGLHRFVYFSNKLREFHANEHTQNYRGCRESGRRYGTFPPDQWRWVPAVANDWRKVHPRMQS